MGRQVFIVEDYERLRKLLEEMLEDWGYFVCGSSGSAEEAVEMLGQVQPDLMLVDIYLPGMNGLDFVSQMHARHPEIGFIVVSGEQLGRYVAAAREAGARAFVGKPQLQQLKKAMEAALVEPTEFRVYMDSDYMGP